MRDSTPGSSNLLAPDLVFNLSMLVLDLLGILWIRSLLARQSPRFFLVTVQGVLVSSCFAIALFIRSAFHFRQFATLRFLGMAFFWHMPLVLFALAILARRRWPIVPAVLVLAIYLQAYFIEPRRLEISHHYFTHPLLKGLHREVILAQISDIQTDHVDGFEARVLSELRRLQPDLIVYTGDYLHCWNAVEYRKQAEALRLLFRETRLRPPLGSYAVQGDADEPGIWKVIFVDEPVRLLENETVILQLPGVQVNLTGLSANMSRASTSRELVSSVHGQKDSNLDVYIGHSPDFVRSLQERNRPFLAIAGHTHGGQVQLPFLGPIFTLTMIPRKYADWYGPYGIGVLSVSRGIGMERYDAPRLRFLCRPEIRVIHLQPPKE